MHRGGEARDQEVGRCAQQHMAAQAAVRAVAQYEARGPQDHSLSIGEVLVVTKVEKNGWSRGFKVSDHSYRELLFPSSYTRAVKVKPVASLKPVASAVLKHGTASANTTQAKPEPQPEPQPDPKPPTDLPKQDATENPLDRRSVQSISIGESQSDKSDETDPQPEPEPVALADEHQHRTVADQSISVCELRSHSTGAGDVAKSEPEPEPAATIGVSDQSASELASPVARSSLEEAAQLEAALKLSTKDKNVRSDLQNEEPQRKSAVSPPSILKKPGKTMHELPPACLDGRELDGEAGRRALSDRVQAVLRSSHGSDPTPEEVSALQKQFSISAEEVMAVCRYFRELMGTFQKNIRESIGL